MKKADAEIRERLDFLSNISDTDCHFITLYMTVNAHSFLDQAEKNRIFLKNSIQKYIEDIENNFDREKLTNFKKDIDKIKHFIKNDLKSQTHGLAIFACEKLGVFETFQSMMPFENEFVVDSFPHLKQFAFQYDEYENALVVMIDSRYSRIFDVKLRKGITNRVEFTDNVHKFHKQGGWAQLRFQRGIEQEKDWHYKDTAEVVAKILDEEDFKNIILVGQNYDMKDFQKFLPKRFHSKIIDTNDLQMRENTNVILENIINDLRAKEKEREFLTVRDIIDKAQTNDSCTLGMDDIIDLAKDGRIETLAVIKNGARKGYRCGECLFTSKNQHKAGCEDCNGSTKETDLIEEVIRLTFKNGGNVELIEPETAAGDELLKHEGIGAYLRY